MPRRAADKPNAQLRWQVLRRDEHRCAYCGSGPLESRLVIDHVMPVALGGATTFDNLVTSCTACNQGKADEEPDATWMCEIRWRSAHWLDAESVPLWWRLRYEFDSDRSYRDHRFACDLVADHLGIALDDVRLFVPGLGG